MTLSVKFFKRLFLFILILMIAIPSVLAIYYGVSYGKVQQDVETQQIELADLRNKLEAAQQELSWARQQLEGGGAGQILPDGTGPAYQSLYPDLYCEPQRPNGWERPENTVYLTFNDGPSDNTDAILDILAQNNVKATFFVTGKTDEDSLNRMKRIVNEGHTIGVYTYSGQYRDIYASIPAYLEDFQRIYTLIYETTGVKPEIFRFVGGSINGYNGLIYQPLIAEMLRRGFTYYDWDAAGGDNLQSATVASIQENVLKGVTGKDRAIILLHDGAGYTATAEALSGVITKVREQGLEFAPLTSKVTPIIFGYDSIP